MKTSKLGKILIVALFIMLFTLVLTVATSAATTNVAAGADLSDAIANAADGDVLVLGGGTYTEADPITIGKSLTIQGSGTVNGGAPIFNVAEGVTVTFGGSVKYVGTGIGVSIQGTNTNVTFKDSVCFETKNRVYQDLNNAYISTVTVQDNVLFKSDSYAIDFDGKETTTGTRAKKTVVVTGATFNCQHGIVFNADYTEASATVTNVTMVNKYTSFYATNSNGTTTITVNGGSCTSTSKDKIAMLGGNASSTTTASFTDVTLTTNAVSSNSGALTAEGGSNVTMTVKNATINVPQTALLLCNAATLNTTLENVTATCRDVANENGKAGKADITIKGTSSITCSTGIFSDGTPDNGSYIKVNLESGSIKSYALCSDTSFAKLNMAVASTLNVKGGSVELEMYSARHNSVTVSVTGGTLTVNGIDASVLDNASAVAKIGDTPYDTLEAAIAAAAAGDTITILKNCTISTAITLNKKLTFTGENVIVSQNGVKLTLADGADITVDGNIAWLDFATISEDTGTAKFVINSGYFTNEYAAMFFAGEQATLNVTINDGTFILGHDLCVRHDDVSGGTTNFATNFTINDGTFKISHNTVFRQGYNNVQNDTKYNININGGSFTWHTEVTAGGANLYFVHIGDWQCQTVVNIKNATFTVPSTVMANDIYYFLYLTAYKLDATLENCTVTGFDYMMRVNRGNKVSKLTIKSGTYSVGTILAVYGSNPGTTNNTEVIDGTLVISGGTFTVSECIVYLANTGTTKSSDAYVTITGGTFNTMKNFAQGGTFTDGWPCTLKVVASNVTINTTGAFFGMSNDTDLKLNVSFTNCTLTSNGRFMSGDIHSITAVFDNTNVTVVERLINLTGSSANASTITITGGTFTIKPLANASAHALMFYINTPNASTTLTINSGTFIADTNGAGEWDGLFILNNGTVNATIKDGTFNSAQIVQFGSAGTLNLTIEKGSFTGTNLFQSLKGGTANITVKSGTFNATRIVDGIKGTTNVTLEGGTFTSTENLINTVYGNTLILTVKGGTYNAGNHFLYAPTTGKDGNPAWSGATVTVNVSGSPEITATNHIFSFYNNAIVNLTVDGGTYTTTEYVVSSNGARMVATWNNGTSSGAKRFISTLWGENAKFVTDPLGKVTNAAMIVIVNGGNIMATERLFSLTDRGRVHLRVNGGTFETAGTTFYSSRSGSNETFFDIEINGGTLTNTREGTNDGLFFTSYKMTAIVTGGTINGPQVPVFAGSSNVSFDVTVSGGKINAYALINVNGTGKVNVTAATGADVVLTKAVFADENADSTQHFTMTGGKLNTPTLYPYASNRNDSAIAITGGELTLNGTKVDLAFEAVAKTEDGTTYATLEEAVAAAPAGSTVTLLKNLVITNHILIDKAITISGGAEGNRITVVGAVPGDEFFADTAHSGYSTFILKDGGNLTLDGYVDYMEVGVTANHVTATLNLKGNISITNMGLDSAIVAYANAEGTPDGTKYTLTVNIYGGTYYTAGAMFYSGNKVEGALAATTSKYYIYGGTFTAMKDTFFSGDYQAAVQVTVDAGTFTGVSTHSFAYNGANNLSVTLNGGNFTGYGTLLYAGRCDSTFTVSDGANVTVTNVGVLIRAASGNNDQNYAKLTATIGGGTYSVTNVVYVADHTSGDKSTLILTVKGGTFTTSGNAFHQASGTSTITVNNMTLTTAGAGFKADNGTISITVNNATINATGTSYGNEPFFFNETCTSATLVVKAGTITANTGLRGLYGRAQKGSYTFGTEGETDHSKLTITTQNQQVFAFHTSGSYTINLTLVVYSGTYTVATNAIIDVNTVTTGSITLHDGIFNGNSPSHSPIDLTGSTATGPSHVNITVKGGTYNVAHGYFINYAHCLQGKGVTITLNNPTVAFKNAGGQVVQVNGTGDNISYADVYVTGGTYTNAAMLVHFDQGVGKIVISGGTAVLTSPYNGAVDNLENAGKNNTDNDAFLIYLSGNKCQLLEGSAISGGNYTVTLVDNNTGAISGNSSVPANLTISGGTINVTNGPLFGYYAHWTVNITGGTVTCRWLVNVNGGSCVENITISGDANVTTTDCVITDGGAGSKVHIQVNGGTLNATNGWSTGIPMSATCTAQITGGTVIMDGHTLYGNGASAIQGADGTRYATLQEAVAAANDGDTLTIIGSFVINGAVEINKNITIKGGTAEAGIVVSGNATAKDASNRAFDLLHVQNGGHLTLDGYVTYLLTGIVVDAGGEVTVKGNTVIDNIRGTSKWSDVITASGNGDRTINISGNVLLQGAYVISFHGGTGDVFSGTKTVNMNGGKLEGSYGIVVNEGGTDIVLNLSNGEIVTSSAAVYFDAIYDATNKNLAYVCFNNMIVTAQFATQSTGHASNSKIVVEGNSVFNTTDHTFYFNTTNALHNTEIEIKGGTFNIADTSKHFVDMNDGMTSKITISGGEFNTNKVASAFLIDLATGNKSTIVISGGTVHDSNYLFNFVASTVDLTVSGDAVLNAHQRFLSATTRGTCNVTINGGTINQSDDGNGGHALMFYASGTTTVNVTVNGGTFNNTSAEFDQHNSIFEINGATTVMNLVLNGGTFNCYNFIWVYNGVMTVKDNGAIVNATGKYVVAPPIRATLADGTNVYGNLTSVINFVPAGSTIEFTHSVEFSDTVTVNKSLTFTGGNVTVTGATGKAMFKITGNATLTFEGSVSYTSDLYIVRIDAATEAFEATVHFKGGSFTNTTGTSENGSIVSDYAPNNTTHLIVEDGVVMACKGWSLHFEGTHAADQNGYKTVTINGGSITGGSHGIVLRAGGLDYKFTVNGGLISALYESFYIENDYYKTDAQENVGEIVITGGTLKSTTNILLAKDGAHYDVTVLGGEFHANRFFSAEGSTDVTMNVTGGSYTVNTFAHFNKTTEAKLTLTMTGMTIAVKDAFFTTGGGVMCVLDCTFTNCDLSTGARFINSDAKQLTFKFKDTNVSSVERMFNMTGVGNTADITIDGGTFTIQTGGGDKHSLMFYSNSQALMTVTIKGGTFKNTDTNASGTHMAFFDIANNDANGLTVIIEDGTFEGSRLVYAEKGALNLTVKNGTFTHLDVIRLGTNHNATIDIQGGTFHCTGAIVNQLANSNGTANVTISGGTFTAPYAVLVAYATMNANLTGGTFEGLALYTHAALNWAPTIGDGAVINTTHRDYHHATFNDGANSYCGSIEAVAGAVAPNSVITIVGQLPYGTYTISNQVIFTGDATATVGSTSAQTKINLGAGANVSFIGGTFINTTVYGVGNNVTATFGGNVQFLNGTSYQVYEDQDGNINATVIVKENAYLQGRWAIDFEGKDTGETGYADHTGVKTVKILGGFIDAQYGIVFNVDGVTADIRLLGGKIYSVKDAIYLNAGNGNGQRLALLIDGITIEAEALGINMVDTNTLVDIVMKSGSIRAGMDGSGDGDYCIELYSIACANPSTLIMTGGTLIADVAHAALCVMSTANGLDVNNTPIAKIYGGYLEGHTLCAARSTSCGRLVIYGGYFAFLPALYTNDGSPVRSGTSSGDGYVEVYGGNFYNSIGYGPAIRCVTNTCHLTVDIRGISALGGQYVTNAATHSTQHRYPDGDHEYEGLISMIDGAGVRLYPDSNGLRFVSVVSGASLNYLRTLGATNFRYGTLIAPVDEVEKADSFTIDGMTRAGAQYINLPAANGLIAREDGGFYIRAALVNIREENIGRDFAAVGYVQYELNGYTVTVYTAYRATRNARSIEQVARLALKDAEKYTPAQQAILEAFAPTEAAPVIDFYLVAGQSNAAGSSHYDSTIMQLRPEYYEGFSHVLYSGSSNTIHRLNTVTKLGYGSAADSFGPELGMADALSQYYNEETGRYAVIVKYAYGGTNLYDSITGSNAPEGNWLPPSWIEAMGGKDAVLSGGLFRALVNHVENSIHEYEAMGFDVNIVAAYWMQGESDVSAHAADGLYDEIFKCWVNDLRSAVVEMTGEEKYNDLPILVGEISEYFGSSSLSNPTYHQNCKNFVKMQREIIGSWDNVYVIGNGNIPTADHANDLSHWGYHEALWIGQHVGQTILTELLGQEIVVPADRVVAEIWLNGELIGSYTELTAAISMAPEGAVVKVLKDLDLYSTLAIGNRNNITIDGNGHTLTFKMVDGSDNSYHSAIKFYTVNLTIKDLFVVLENKAWGSQLFLGSNVTWIGGGFEAQELCFVLNHDGSLNIESGEFYTRGTTNSGFGVVYFGTANKIQSLTISGGTFNAGATGAGSTVIVTASTTKPVITITGGTFIGAPETDVVIDINSTTATLYLDPNAVTVIGGTVAGLENSGNTLRK